MDKNENEKAVRTVTVWGLAAGVRSTAEAARGAFTSRDYPEDAIPFADWLQIVTVEQPR